MAENIDAAYYVHHQKQFIRLLRSSSPFIRLELSRQMGKEQADQITKEMTRRFIELLPTLPYIGGDEVKGFTRIIAQGGQMLAFYQTMRDRGYSPEEAGQILYNAVRRMYRSFPMRWVLKIMGWSEGRKRMAKLRKVAERSQAHRYAGDWVFTYVEGDVKSFDWGLDYTECGLVKYFKAHQAEAFVPYLCLLDYPQFEAMGWTLNRTSTLAQGGTVCNFRCTANRKNCQPHVEMGIEVH